MAQTKIKAGLFEGIIGNGTDGYFLMSNGDGTMTWSSVVINPTIVSIAYPGSVTAADPAGGETITVTGTGFKSGATVTIGGTAAPAVSYVSETQITFTTPAKAAGDYDIVFTNTDTGSATYINGISYNGIPTWTTAAGSLGTFASGATISTITLQATEPDAGTITFNITNGALPTGLSLTGANIDGTTSLETADTLYTFTVTATDDESQATPRTFTITVTKQFINTDNFTINTYTGNGSTQSIEGKIGTAADFNGSSSYVRLPNNFINSNDFTVSLWINASALGAYDSLFGAYGATPGVNYGWVIYLDNGAVRFLSYSSNGDMNFASSSTLSINTWYNVVLTYSASDCIIYINGVNDGNSVPPGNRVYTSAHPYVLGATDDNGTIVSYFPGKIDQVRIFNKALSSSEVTTLYGESNTSTTKSTTDIFDDGSGVALYEFEEGAKDTGGVNGYIGAAGVFNGSSSVITPPAFGNTYPFTYSVWINPNSVGDTSIINDTISGNRFLFATISSLFGRTNYFIMGQGGQTHFGTPSNTVVANTWSHVVLVATSVNNYTLYIDGVLQTLTNLGGTMGGAASYAIGANGTGGEYFNGKIDQVRIFNRALDETTNGEVTTLYGETSASATKSTTDIFGDSSGIALYELEGNANDTGGTYNGTATNVSYAYDGTPTNVSFAGTSFQPDFVWIKQRTGSAANNLLFDSIRGAHKQIMSNTTSSGVDRTSVDKGLTSFDSNGFTVKDTSTGDYEINGPNGGTYSGNGSYVAWAWKAGGTAVSNTDGSITSTVSANPDAGFSIVKYTGNNTNSTVGHGLSSAPELVLYKVLSAAGNWTVYSSTLTDSHYLKLNTTDGQISEIYNIFNGQPDASVLKLGSGGSINGNSYEYIAYCFHSVDGYQKVGSFDGTGTTTGNIVTTGFRPRFLMWKSTIGTGNWQIVDSIRSPLADKRNYLYSDLSQGEDVTSYDIVDFNDDSFQMKQQYSNKSNETYIYLAIA